MSKIAEIQKILFPDSPQEWDGIWGGHSQSAIDALINPSVLKGTVDGWEFLKARIDGSDIVIDDAEVTAFGGANDTGDSGETASGVSTKNNPKILGCALPMRRNTSPRADKKGRHPILRGSPLPMIPWMTPVIFTDPITKKRVTTKLIDEGPAGWTKHAGDLTVAAARKFDPKATANSANIPRLQIRIVGGAALV